MEGQPENRASTGVSGKKNPNRKTVGILCLVEVAGIEPASIF
jgi:hypothetical protein